MARSAVNRYVRIIVRAFRWAVANERAPRDISEGLPCVEPLRISEFGVPEGRIVKPAPEAHVDTIREYVSPVVWAMVTVQRYSAARASEVVVMPPKDLNVSGKVWLHRPPEHKNRHRGRDAGAASVGPCSGRTQPDTGRKAVAGSNRGHQAECSAGRHEHGAGRPARQTGAGDSATELSNEEPPTWPKTCRASLDDCD